MDQNERVGSTDDSALAGIARAERQMRLTLLVLRRSRLSDEEAALLREVFGEILAAHHDLVWNRLRKRGLESHDAEELQQEVFFTLYSHILEHGFPDTLSGLLRTLTEGKLLNFLRIRRRAPLSVALPSSSSEKPTTSRDVERAMDIRQLARHIFSRLSLEHQEVVEKVVVNGLSHSEAAAVLGLPEGTVKSRIMAAKRALLALVEPFLPASQRGLG